MTPLMQNVASVIANGAVGVLGAGNAQSLFDTAVGIFGGTAQGRNSTVPVAGSVGALTNALAVPQNSRGLGIFSQLVNSNPVGTMVANLGNNVVAQAVQFSGSTKTGVVPISNNAIPAVQMYGTPVSTVAQPIKAQSLTLSGAVGDIQKKIDQAQGSDSGDLGTLIAAGAITKLLGLW